MKKILLFLLLIISGHCFGQAYITMPTDTATWRYRIKSVDDFTTITDFILYMNGQDTVIGSNTYTKIFSRSVTRTGVIGYNPPVASIVATTPDIFYGGIRESGKQVFFITVSTEQIIFDFTAGIGTFIPASTGTLKVVAIDSILIGSTYHKRYRTTDSTYYTVEGVGSNRGLIPSLNDGSGYVTFHCFTHGADMWTPIDTIPCTAVYEIGYNDAVKNITTGVDISISPNPASGIAHLSCSGSGTLHGIVTNCLGQKMWEGDLSGATDIAVYGWPQGVYYIWCSNPVAVPFVKKLVLD